MSSRLEYVKRASQSVIAVQVDLETAGFTYREMGCDPDIQAGGLARQQRGDVYTIDRDTFARTYRQTGPGTFVKVTPVWTEVATEPGVVRTKEGSTHYERGDYLVYNQPDGDDAYAVSRLAFERMYERSEHST